ncbi:MAG: sulfotransferase [Armatimonadetes bacterium]|nr:sulfotransferase [Armatimonadota bacterium]
MAEGSRSRPPFFIIGAARSGTTLFRVVLDRHRDVAVPPESHFIPLLYARRERYGRDGRVAEKNRFLHDLARNQRFRDWDLPIEAVREELAGLPTPTFSQAIAAAFRAYARREHKPRWGDKTPRYVDVLPLMDHLFPEALFLHVIRDGRDVALSHLEHRGRRPAITAWFWARAIRRARAAARTLGPARYLEVQYERFLDDPADELRRICAFLDLSFDPAMLREDEKALERLPPHRRATHSRLVLAPTKGLRNWRSQMSPGDLAEFEAVAGPVLARAGYEAATRTGRTVRARAWSRVYRSRAVTILRRLGRRAAGEEEG